MNVLEISAKTRRLRERFALRDQRMRDVASIRRGDVWQVAPGLFPADYPKPLVANFIDVAARDMAESAADLPAFNCSSSNMVSDQAKKRADKRTKIVNYGIHHSKLDVQMVNGADHWFSYGLVVFHVEPDFDAKCPRITVEDPTGGYPEIDRFGRTISFTKVICKTIDELVVDYPALERQIRGSSAYTRGTSKLELVRYDDKDHSILFIPERSDLVLSYAPNLMGVCPFVVRERPSFDAEERGQFDEVIWVQLARAKFALLALEAADKSVQAPLAVPDDVDEFAYGPDAIIRTREPQNIRHVGIDVPAGAFQEMQTLSQELRTGSRYPEGRTGNIDASVITGQGVQALLSGFDGQIKTAQMVFASAFTEAVALWFKLDETFWPNLSKTIRGTQDGSPYEVTYVPSKDIAGDHTVDVAYGMLGLDKNRALVFLLQLRGDKLVSRDFVRRQMPFPLDVTQEEQRVDIEETRDALKQAIAGMAMSVPQLAAAGQDVSSLVGNLAEIIRRRQKGAAIEDVVAQVFSPPPTAPPDQQDPMAQLMGGGAPPAGPPGGGAPQQMGGAPGQQPDLETMLAGLGASGQPNLRAAVSRKIPA